MGVFMRYGVMAQRKKAEVDIYATQYLTFESPTNNITITPKYNQPGVSLQYSINGAQIGMIYSLIQQQVLQRRYYFVVKQQATKLYGVV